MPVHDLFAMTVHQLLNTLGWNVYHDESGWEARHHRKGKLVHSPEGDPDDLLRLVCRYEGEACSTYDVDEMRDTLAALGWDITSNITRDPTIYRIEKPGARAKEADDRDGKHAAFMTLYRHAVRVEVELAARGG